MRRNFLPGVAHVATEFADLVFWLVLGVAVTLLEKSPDLVNFATSPVIAIDRPGLGAPRSSPHLRLRELVFAHKMLHKIVLAVADVTTLLQVTLPPLQMTMPLVFMANPIRFALE